MTTTTETTEQFWHFTFGSGITHPVTSIDLAEHYVTIKGTWDEARAEMVARFGTAWCDQYEAYTDGSQWITEELTELDRIEWPALPDPGPDYWVTVADGLEEIAGKLRTLAGSGIKPQTIGLSISAGIFARDHERTVPIVERITEALGGETEDRKLTASTWYRSGNAKFGPVNVEAHADIPAPEDPEKAAMRAELEALRAQLGGTR